MPVPQKWIIKNQKYLSTCIDRIKAILEKHDSEESDSDSKSKKKNGTNYSLPKWTDEESAPSIETISSLFGLSLFERYVLLLCAGAELNAEIPQLCAKVQGNANFSYPTFGLALTVLPDANLYATTPVSPLRRFRLVELYNANPSISLMTAPIRIEEKVLHFLTGISYLEPKLHGIVGLYDNDSSLPLVKSHENLVKVMLDVSGKIKNEKIPTFQIWGADETSKLNLAGNACNKMGLILCKMSAESIPSKTDELDLLTQYWSREATLLGSGLYISAEDVELGSATQKIIIKLIQDLPGPLFLGTRERWSLPNGSNASIKVKNPTRQEQTQLWNMFLRENNYQLDDFVDNGKISRIVNQFDLNAHMIRSATMETNLLVKNGKDLSQALWDASRIVTCHSMTELAEQIASKANMEELVLPAREKKILQDIVVHVSHRTKVYDEWGFDSLTTRGLGITALFAGPTGTGKTMAAEVLAKELSLDLFRIDLSTVVSKYIGETSKNLRKVFDAAEEGGMILFFDEADALFGKRTEIRDSHDRYANVEVNYLLQRMESYRGLAILATNMKNAIDPSIIRRIRFIVNFPFPDEKSRKEIWKHAFPDRTPTAELDFQRLAHLNISGGNIRNIAINAAFLAADEAANVSMKHIERAAQSEYDKLERAFTPREL